MSSVPVLPAELHDYILDFLHGDADTLRRCYAFTRVLATNPALASHVATLEIEGAFGIFSMDRLHGATLDAWLRAIPDPVIHQLSNLTKLELALITIDSELARRVFGRLSSITHLTLWACALTSFDVFVELLTSYPRLNRLSIAFTQEWETHALHTATIPRDVVMPQLEVVELTSSCDHFKALRWLIANDLHRSIHTLSCSRVAWSSLASLADILGALAPTLHTLRVGFRDNSCSDDLASPSWSLPVFVPLTRLESLTLDVHTNRIAATPYTLFLISRLSVPALRKLVFAVKCGEFDTTTQIPWARLAEASARVARTTKLERVAVSAKDRGDDGDGVVCGGFAARGVPPVDFADMEAKVFEAFTAQGLEKLVRFVKRA
ncbi:hypothetical protein C8Q80DRAFT_1218579 [Daedaleopsis nitida]|nr:hypothetical protein C8Q80DRAFT_1218579 [Daedaleopsis nitida]